MLKIKGVPLGPLFYAAVTGETNCSKCDAKKGFKCVSNGAAKVMKAPHQQRIRSFLKQPDLKIENYSEESSLR